MHTAFPMYLHFRSPTTFHPLSMSAKRFSWFSMLTILPHSSRPFVSFLSFCAKPSFKPSAPPRLRVSSFLPLSLPLPFRPWRTLRETFFRPPPALHPLGAARCRTPGSGAGPTEQPSRYFQEVRLPAAPRRLGSGSQASVLQHRGHPARRAHRKLVTRLSSLVTPPAGRPRHSSGQSPQKPRLPQPGQKSPRHTASNWPASGSTSDGSSVRMPFSKLRFRTLFAPMPAPVRFALPK